jgi:hypothetical protein
MTNRLPLALAVGAGYLLGRTKKAKLALGVGTMVLGKKLPLNPQALLGVVNNQLLKNPQFKEIGDQLRQDLRGVGSSATNALVTRQAGALADRLHERTLGVRDQISGVAPGVGGEDEERDEPEEPERTPRRSAAKTAKTAKTKSAAGKAAKSAKSVKKTAQQPARKTAKKAPQKTARKKTAAAARGGGSRG